MKRFPLLFQLALILFSVMVIPTTILTWHSGNQILHNSEHEIANSSLAGLIAKRNLNETALKNLSRDTIRLSATNVFDRIRLFNNYDKITSNYENVSKALTVLRELQNINHRADGVYSSFFYLDGADYVVSTDKSITKLAMYESVDWIEQALANRKGIGGVWYPRKLYTGENVISYVLPLNRISTTTRGTIVVNLKESQISSYLSSSDLASRGYRLINKDGTIISHDDKSELLENIKGEQLVLQLLQNKQSEGYEFHEVANERLLYTWCRSKLYGWTNVNIFSVNELMVTTQSQQKSNILLTAIIIFIGTASTVFLATWLSKPARELVRRVNLRGDLGVRNKNELQFLDAAFRRMQEEEEKLNLHLKEREQDMRKLAVQNLLRGEVSSQLADIFPETGFLVVVISIDRYQRYVNKHNTETRSYHRYLLSTFCEGQFPETIVVQSVYLGEGNFCIVMNYSKEESGSSGDVIRQSLVQIRDEAAEVLGHTVTIGVSNPSSNFQIIPQQYEEAMEMIKHRMMTGSGDIHYSRREKKHEPKYMYPSLSERRIVNYLNQGDLSSIAKELEQIRKEIQTTEFISYDNILFIFNQLVGITIKYLRENEISTTRIFTGRGNIYSMLASLDTLEDIEKYLYEFYSEIIQYLTHTRSPGDQNQYGERITVYLRENFCKEVSFEEMAKEIGISYSYMRRIVFEMTGKSLIDYLNMLRIEKAKLLLSADRMTISQIAAEVGYDNVRSLNRFFRKYEGMPPSSYKGMNSKK